MLFKIYLLNYKFALISNLNNLNNNKAYNLINKAQPIFLYINYI